MDIFLSKKRDGILSPPISYDNGTYDFVAKNVSNLTEALVEYKKHYGNLHDLDLRLGSDNQKSIWSIAFEHLSNSDFSGTLFDRCFLRGDNMENINFTNANITNSRGTIDANNCIFDNCNIEHNDLFLCNFYCCSFFNTSMNYNYICNLNISDDYKKYYKKDYNFSTFTSDLNLKSFNGNKLVDNVNIPNESFKNEKVKYHINKYAQNYLLATVSMLTLPVSTLLAHYGYMSHELNHNINYIGYGCIAGNSIKNTLKANPNRLYDKATIALSFFAKKMKNSIFKKTSLDYSHYFHTNNKELLEDIQKMLNSMPERDVTFTSKYKDLNMMFVSENNFLQIMNILIKSKKNYIGQNDKPFILINDNSQNTEIQAFLKTQNEYIFIEKGEPNKIYTFDKNELNDQFYSMVDKTINDFGQRYEQSINQEFKKTFGFSYPYDQATHFLAKNAIGYYVVNMDTLVNENGLNPTGIFQQKNHNENTISNEDNIYNIFYSDEPTKTAYKEEIKEIIEEDKTLQLSI